MEKVYSTFMTLTKREQAKAALIAVIGVLAGIIYNAIVQWCTVPDFDIVAVFTNWPPIVKACLVAALPYIAATLPRNSEGKFLKKEPK